MAELYELAETIQLISDVGRISLEVEISYNDVQERCRTLEMYGIESADDKNIMVASQKLPHKWRHLYNLSKEIEHQLRHLKDREIRQLESRVHRYEEKLDLMMAAFMGVQGPYKESIELEQVAELIVRFQRQIELIAAKGNELNKTQKVFKQPITDFNTLRYVQRK